MKPGAPRTDLREPTRRSALAAIAAAGGVMLTSPVAPFAASAKASPAPSFAEIAPGIFMRSGKQAEMDGENHGAIANIGFVVGQTSVAVIDTGATTRQGQALREAVQATGKPISHVIATHVHPDHCFGHGAFAEGFAAGTIANAGHHRLPRALAERGAYYLERLAAIAPEGSEARFIAPSMLVQETMTIDLGNRALRLTAWPAAHTDNDLTIHDLKTDTFWASDLVFNGRIPVLDGSLTGWLAALRTLVELAPASLVPGHGEVGPPGPMLQRQRAYLEALASGVREAIAQGLTIDETVTRLADLGRGDWLLFDGSHGRNIVTAYTELEWE
ncbi:quinoprotein relay system zinc metallohydrolase 2 [Breoghania sp.]|uniref:quinoprotein relay system zinc metallohydrolase 2 n=1 Tax=Breoghania sp. TaxID=2065378 RepID=UPI002AAB421B|nr:quinoprotein relay system zinc metallohydrolase 2 [Breoghania sp.]